MAPKEIDAAIERFSGIITENKGMIRKVDKWGKRRLAYEIKKKQYGFYVSLEFEGIGNIPGELENEYNYNDKVMRFLTYRYDKHKLKALELEKAEQAKETTSAPQAKTAPAAQPKDEKPEEEKKVEETAATAKTVVEEPPKVEETAPEIAKEDRDEADKGSEE